MLLLKLEGEGVMLFDFAALLRLTEAVILVSTFPCFFNTDESWKCNSFIASSHTNIAFAESETWNQDFLS